MTDTITVVGNIATNPEQRTAGDLPVTSFRIATSERRPDAQGAWIDAHTNYYTVSAFRSLAEHAFVSLRRGDRVIVTGRLRVKEWTAADGSRGRSVDLDADALGHDLRFGTTVFQRNGRPETAADARPAESSGEWPATTADEAWAAPGAGRTDPGTGEIDDDDETSGASGELALAGAGSPF